MNHARKRLIAEIDRADYHLALQQNRAKEYSASLKKIRVDHARLLVLACLVPALIIGWKMSHGKWINKVATQAAQIVTITFFGYFRKRIVGFLSA
jgi:hypothetical protein